MGIGELDLALAAVGHRHGTWLVTWIYLPRNGRDRGRKERQPLNIQLVPETDVDRHRDDQFQKKAVKERQLELEPVQVDVLKMPSELPVLVVDQKVKVKVARRVDGVQASQLFADAAVDNVRHLACDIFAKESWRDLGRFAGQMLGDDGIDLTRAHQLDHLFGQVNMPECDAAALAAPNNIRMLGR